MQCIRPLKANFTSTGDLSYSMLKSSKETVGFNLPCRKCLACRLNMAKEKALRCYHESKIHENNIFLTLTYDQEHLKSPKLNYLDFQLFMKSLRKRVLKGVTDKDLQNSLKISYMVTGEYGEENKRPHWHAIIFNYKPDDAKYQRKTFSGEQVYTSETINQLWGKGATEFGSVTMDSANYVARYAAKKLVHGRDHEHEYHPIHKTSSRRAIGRPWIEKYYQQTFTNGFVVLPDGNTAPIPRYYVDWAKNHKNELWRHYVTEVRPKIQEKAEIQARKDEMEFFSNLANTKGGKRIPKTKIQVKEIILKSKFKKLQENLKL